MLQCYYTEAVIIKNKSNHGVTIQIELLFSALYTVRKVKLTLSIIMSHCVKGALSDTNLLSFYHLQFRYQGKGNQ